jgi:sortase B
LAKRKKKQGGSGYTVGIILCICVALYAGYHLFQIINEYRKGTEEYRELQELTVETPKEPDEDTDSAALQATAASDGTGESGSLECPISVDFDELREINPDIKGWIYIEAVNISYPIVQGENDGYYLHRTFRHKSNFSGSIFMEYQNKANFTDPNTIIYGHNMKNGSMFGKLKHLKSDGLYKQNPYFWILTPEGNICCRMFSLRQVDVDSSVYTLFEVGDESFIQYAEKMQRDSEVETETETFTNESRIVTLSTCTGDSARRFVVQAVQIPAT